MMKNKLGHDNSSEIRTVIARMRENKFKILKFNSEIIEFKIKLKHTILCNCVSLENYTISEYYIKREKNGNLYKYFFKQKDGIPERELKLFDGYIIWGLLEEKLNYF